MNAYPFQETETEAQALWRERNLFAADENAPGDKFYCLSMFPYPSGRLHMGHVRNYTIGDMIARYRRMCGDNVLQPMGWDAFGLPAENAAIDNNIPPAQWTRDNISDMRAQLQRLGLAVDWRRELATCDESYYLWEQQFFVRLFKQGLIYKKTATVNWDPVDNTVLANEQVVDGRGWRSGAPIERRDIPMYFMAISRYADELLDELDNLNDWPESVKAMQRNWIGRSDGARVRFQIEGSDAELEFYTTRPDTIYGVTFCAIAPEHPVALQAAKSDAKLQAFIDDCRKLAVNEEALEKVEKTGYLLPFKAVHPLDSSRTLPVFVANYILAQYGTGAIYGCPAHDQRDLDFARRYQLPVIPVVSATGKSDIQITDTAPVGKGIMINSGELNGMNNEDAKTRAIELLQAAGRGVAERQYRLRDWGISRQRYWGCPIPVIHCDNCGDVPEKEENLPVRLPQDVTLDGRGSPLARLDKFIHCACPQCGKPARRETDTMDTFVESSWYFARFASHDCDTAMTDKRAAQWMPVNQYVGGIEHACLHLLYARFYHKLMRDAGMYPKEERYNEPFTRLLCQGMVLKDGAKMSKSKGNTVDPQELIDTYGADTARLFILFAAPPQQALEWSEDGVKGCARFLGRLWAAATALPQWEAACGNTAASDDDNAKIQDARRHINRVLQKAGYDMQRQHFNNIPSAAMNILNTLQSLNQTKGAATVLRDGISVILRLLAPAVPHITQALWKRLQFGDIIANESYPHYEPTDFPDNTPQQLVVQVNGKKRGVIRVAADANDNVIRETAKQAVKQHLVGDVKKIIIVAGKIVNIVL